MSLYLLCHRHHVLVNLTANIGILRDNSKKVKLPPTYPKIHLRGIDGEIVYCEPTGKGYKPGEIGPNVDQNSVIII